MKPGIAASRSQAYVPAAEINMIPLIDVMLVLLVIFIIAAPLVTHAVKIDLPQASSTREAVQPRIVRVVVDAAGELYLGPERVRRDQLARQFADIVARDGEQAELRINADAAAPYRAVAEVMSDASRSGIARIGFVTQPTR
jgi:biopolymer transport protein ExbD